MVAKTRQNSLCAMVTLERVVVVGDILFTDDDGFLSSYSKFFVPFSKPAIASQPYFSQFTRTLI